jgi:S-adenosylmethionine:tRNA ribosyltransferase-isomerase
MNPDLYSSLAYSYDLPKELIAQYPCPSRDQSRLMIVERSTGKIYDTVFSSLYDFLQKEDSLVFNDTKVIPAKLIGKRESGGKAEILLTRRNNDETWDVLAKPGKKLRLGSMIEFGPGFTGEILGIYPDGSRRIRFFSLTSLEEALFRYGQIPLPHYISRDVDPTVDATRYQTVFAVKPGALAAPTAGLHFTPELLEKLAKKNISQTYITLHVGLGTFLPVKVKDIRDHPMHTEEFYISQDAAARLNSRPSGKRQICVGTTCCRALESAADSQGNIVAGNFQTKIFIHPGYSFKYVRTLLTNFHLPCSTLLMLVSAFGGYELIREAYAKAVEKRFRFFSYGDSMLIL